MAFMSGGTPTIQIPRWIQLVGLPVLALIAILLAGKVFHAVFLFLVAGLIALLLDPLVRALERVRIPRGFSIAIVYLSFAAALVVVAIAIGVIVSDQTQSAANRVDTYLTKEDGQSSQTGFEQDVDSFQRWLDTHHLERVDIRKQGQEFAANIKGQDVEKYTSKAIDFPRGAAVSIFQLVFSLVLIVVVSIYMLLDMGRLKRAVDRRFPPRPGESGLVIQWSMRSRATYVGSSCCRRSSARAPESGSGCSARSAGSRASTTTRSSSVPGSASRSSFPTSARGSAGSFRSPTRSSSIRSRLSGCSCSSSGSTRSRATSSSRT